MKYEFHVGDYVETKNGGKGYVSNAKNLWWKCTHESEGYGEGCGYSIIGVDDGTIADFFNRIGQYDFTKKDEGKIKPLQKSWVLDENDSNGEHYFDTREVILKINELVKVVNRLEEIVNNGE